MRKTSEIINDYWSLDKECKAMLVNRLKDIEEYEFDGPFGVLCSTSYTIESIDMIKIKYNDGNIELTSIEGDIYQLSDVLNGEIINILCEIE